MQVRFLALSCALGLAGCSVRSPQTIPAPVTPIAANRASWCDSSVPGAVQVDSELFSRVIDQLLATYRDPLAMTPWPIGDSPLHDEPARARPDSTWSAFAAARLAVLEARHIRVVNDVALSHCVLGAQLVAPQPGCPDSRAEYVAVGVARHGGAYYPPLIDNRAVGDAEGLCTIRVVTTNASPGGLLRAYLDYLFMRANGHWKLVNVVELLSEP